MRRVHGVRVLAVVPTLAVIAAFATFAAERDARSAPAAPRRVQVSADAAALSSALLPDDLSQDWSVCAADCPSGVTSVRISDPAIDFAGAAVRIRGKVRADVAVVGPVAADVTCTAVPELLDAGRVRVGARSCALANLGQGYKPWVQRGLAMTVEPALGALLADQLGRLPPYELLDAAKDGWLAAYNTDAALQAPGSAGCVQAIRGVDVRSEPAAVVVQVDVTCGG